MEKISWMRINNNNKIIVFLKNQAEGKKRAEFAFYRLSGPKPLMETQEHSATYFSILAAP